MGDTPKPIEEEAPPAPPPAKAEQPPAAETQPAVEADEQGMPSDIEPTKAELEAAQAEIDLLDPKQWIAIVAHIRRLEDVAKENMTEAPAIAWTNLYGPQGGQINITCRDITGELAYEELMKTVKYAMRDKNLQWSPVKQFPTSSQATTTATAADVAPSGDEKLKVESVTHTISKNGKHYINVKTVDPRFNQYGVNAWPEVIPEDFEDWQVGQPYSPPDSMKFATISKWMQDGKERKKVTKFHSS